MNEKDDLSPKEKRKVLRQLKKDEKKEWIEVKRVLGEEEQQEKELDLLEETDIELVKEIDGIPSQLKGDTKKGEAKT